jgi:hypothetical protein
VLKIRLEIEHFGQTTRAEVVVVEGAGVVVVGTGVVVAMVVAEEIK